MSVMRLNNDINDNDDNNRSYGAVIVVKPLQEFARFIRLMAAKR